MSHKCIFVQAVNCTKRWLCSCNNCLFHGGDAGKGAVYSFDPVGSYQRDTYKAGGSASAMLQPLLDNQVNINAAYCPAFCHDPTFSMDKVCSKSVSPSTDWFQEHGGCAACSSDSGQGGSAGERRLHLGCRERCLHWRCPSGLCHHQGRHQRADRTTEKGLRREMFPFFCFPLWSLLSIFTLLVWPHNMKFLKIGVLIQKLPLVASKVGL